MSHTPDATAPHGAVAVTGGTPLDPAVQPTLARAFAALGYAGFTLMLHQDLDNLVDYDTFLASPETDANPFTVLSDDIADDDDEPSFFADVVITDDMMAMAPSVADDLDGNGSLFSAEEYASLGGSLEEPSQFEGSQFDPAQFTAQPLDPHAHGAYQPGSTTVPASGAEPTVKQALGLADLSAPAPLDAGSTFQPGVTVFRPDAPLAPVEPSHLTPEEIARARAAFKGGDISDQIPRAGTSTMALLKEIAFLEED